MRGRTFSDRTRSAVPTANPTRPYVLTGTKKKKKDTCECCRLGLAFAGPGRPVVVFRNIFEGGVRDHAVMTFTDPATPGEVRRVSNDDWQIAACPHHGPSLSISPAGTYHVSWYTNGKARKGLFYARSQDEGRTFSDPLPLGRSDRNPTRPYVLAGPRGATMVWKEFDGEKTSVNAMISHDEGKSWSKPVVIATTTDTSDHPLLVSDGQHDLSFLDDQGRRISPAADRRWIMKRRLLAAIFLVAFLAAAPAAETPSELKPFVRGSWQEVLRSHAGRPTLVHFWGVTCGPCKVELPLLGQFMKDHAELDVVTISADLVPNLPGAARAMLEKAGLGAAENWIFSDGFVERLRFEIDPAWQGDIPRTLLIARDGTVTTIEGSAEIPDLEKWLGSAKGREQIKTAPAIVNINVAFSS